MVREAFTGYWSLVSGLTEVTLERARTAAKVLVAQGDATREQMSGLAQEIADTSRANREALVKLIRYETERAAGRLGFASSDEVSTLQGRVRELERSIVRLRMAADAAEPTGTAAGGKPASKPASAPVAAPAAGPAKAAKKAPAARPASPAKAAKANKVNKAAKATKATKIAKTTARKQPPEAGASRPGTPS
jgi:polyhydroxyalkanoate synthesis regulator phasin